MEIAGIYSFKYGQDVISEKYSNLDSEVIEIIARVDAAKHRTKASKEKTMPGKMLFNPISLNNAFESEFGKRGWVSKRVKCDYPKKFYTPVYQPRQLNKGAFREMDFIKQKLGVDVQFGKYAFMVYNVCAKMTIFNKLGFIDAGIEIVPIRDLAQQMSTGVSYFEQFVWDLEHRGVSDIDIPVLIYGVGL